MQRAAAASPHARYSYTNRASVFTTRKEYDRALADLQKAVDISPSSARVYTGLGNALLSLKREEDALAAFNQAIALDPRENGALGALGGWAAREKRLQVTRDKYRSLLFCCHRV